MNVELSQVLDQLEMRAKSHSLTSEMYKKEGNTYSYFEFACRASALRMMSSSLEIFFQIKESGHTESINKEIQQIRIHMESHE